MVKVDNGVQVSRLRKLQTDSNVKAFADVTFAGMFLVKGLRIIEGKNGLFVGMPRERGKDGKWYDTAHPLTKEFRELLNDVVLAAYESE